MDNKKTLLEFYSEHEGKASDKWESYLEVYDQILGSYREKPVSLLEIGVQNGGSLEIWAKYFPLHQHIVGCDVNKECGNLSYSNERIKVVVGDATNGATYKSITDISKKFTLIIDDGSHQSSDIIRTFCNYLVNLEDEGLFIIEDLHCSYWDDFEGGINYPYSSINFFKKIIDIVNYQHWGINVDPLVLLNGFRDIYNLDLDRNTFLGIQSISFYDSICVVKKSALQAHRLGRRLVIGTEDSVVKGNFQFSESYIRPQNQEFNAWSFLPDLKFNENLILYQRKITEQKVAIELWKDKYNILEREISAKSIVYEEEISVLKNDIELLKRSFLNRAINFAKRML